MQNILQALDHSSAVNRVAAVHYDIDRYSPAGEITFYSSDGSTQLGAKTLPPFLVRSYDGYHFVPSVGNFAYFSRNGSKVFVCVQTRYNNYDAKWGIATINVD